MNLTGTYLDIGTNVGTHAVYFGLFCQCKRVIGFEPVKRWRDRALENLAANNLLGKVEILENGVSDKQEIVPFDIAGAGTTLSCKTLDDLVPDLNDVSFVKMDIEGCEPKAFLGGREFFLQETAQLSLQRFWGVQMRFLKRRKLLTMLLLGEYL